MINKQLVKEVAARIKNPSPRTAKRESFAIASMVAESLKLSGIMTTLEDVLKSYYGDK